MNEEVFNRFKLLIQIESVKTPWLEEQTGVKAKRWSNVINKTAKLYAEELGIIAKIWPEYSYWLITGEELPDIGQISPHTKATNNK